MRKRRGNNVSNTQKVRKTLSTANKKLQSSLRRVRNCFIFLKNIDDETFTDVAVVFGQR